MPSRSPLTTRYAGFIFFAIFLSNFLFSVSPSFAQVRKPYVIPLPPKDTSTFLIFHDVTAGPYLTAGVDRQNEDLPEGWTSTPRFSWILGGTLDLAVNQWYGIVLSMLYDSRDLYLADATGDNIDLALGYLSFQPSIRLLWLLLGVSFDIPMSGSATEYMASYTRPDQPATHNYNENLNVQTSDLASVTELRATISVPVTVNEGQYVHFLLSGSYPLGKMLAGTSSFDTTGRTTTNPTGAAVGRFSGSNMAGKGPLPIVEAGISYEFDLLH